MKYLKHIYLNLSYFHLEDYPINISFELIYSPSNEDPQFYIETCQKMLASGGGGGGGGGGKDFFDGTYDEKYPWGWVV